METLRFERYGAAGLVEKVRTATRTRSPQHAEQFLRAMIRLETREDQRAAFDAGAPLVIAECLTTFPKELGIARAALVAALFRSWKGGIFPFRGAPTKEVVKAIGKAMLTFKQDLLVVQGGLRLLRLHTSSEYQLVETVACVEAAAMGMRMFPLDDSVQHFGAHVIASANGMEPGDLKRAHGEIGYNSIVCTSVAMAVNSPPSLRIGDTSWQDLVLACHPRFRERPH